MIQMSLTGLRQLESLAEKARGKAAKEIARESAAWCFFDALDQIPAGWPVEYGECDDFCRRCLDRVAAKPKVKKLLGADWDGPHRDDTNEGEHSRNCYVCGCPLPWALLEYGMETEIDHYERVAAKAEKWSANDWYWLWQLADECLRYETYLNTYGERVRRVLVAAFLGKDHHSYAAWA